MEELVSPIFLERKATRSKEPHWLLPLPPVPLEDESRLSFLTRISHRNAAKFYYFFDETLNMTRDQFRELNFYLDPKICDKLSHHTGVSKSTLYNLGLDRWREVIPNLIVFWRRRYGKWFCPVCLIQEPQYYRLNWTLGFVAVCQHHKCLLLHRCPNCNWFVDPESVSWRKSLSTCNNCEQDLGCELEKLPHNYQFSSNSPFLEAPQHILTAMKNGYWVGFDGEIVPLHDFFTGLYILARVVGRAFLLGEFESTLPHLTKYLVNSPEKGYYKKSKLSPVSRIVFRTPANVYNAIGTAITILKGDTYFLEEMVTNQQFFFNRITGGECPQFLRPFRKLRHPRREKVTREEVLAAISYLEKEREYVSPLAVARKIDCALDTILKRPDLKKLIEKKKSKPIMKYLKHTEEILRQFQENGFPITKTAIAQELGITVDTLNKYPELLNLIAKTVKEYASKTYTEEKRPTKYFLGPSSETNKEDVQNYLQSMSFTWENISFRSVSKKTGIYRQRLQEDLELRQIIETAIQQQHEYWESEVKKICRQIINKKLPVTFVAVAGLIGIDRKKLVRNTKLQPIVASFKEKQNMFLVNEVEKSIMLLTKRNERITVVNIARTLNIPVKRISENQKLRKIIKEARKTN
ncbi:MAG: TniQ family protein [Candidatus Heimdallarchaeota archaeon]